MNQTYCCTTTTASWATRTTLRPTELTSHYQYRTTTEPWQLAQRLGLVVMYILVILVQKPIHICFYPSFNPFLNNEIVLALLKWGGICRKKFNKNETYYRSERNLFLTIWIYFNYLNLFLTIWIYFWTIWIYFYPSESIFIYLNLFLSFWIYFDLSESIYSSPCTFYMRQTSKNIRLA